jgi:pseudouridine-5'-phosphate glycosidase
MTLKILDPTVQPERAESVVAKRVAGLDGKVLGLLNNSKVNGDRLLALVREELLARYDVRDVVAMTKAGASTVADDAMLEALAARCDVVVTAIGD